MAVIGLDHIIYATPDLQGAIEKIAALTGVEPALGGSHPGRGTRNALFSLGSGAYIEILAPDPAQSAEALGRAAARIPPTARLTTWAARCDDLEQAVAEARGGGLDLGAIETMSRTLPSGEELRWRLTRGTPPGDGLVPFLIDWGSTPHPSDSAPAGCRLRFLRAEHPDPVRIRGYLTRLGLESVLEVSQGEAPRLLAGLSTPNGDLVLS